MLAMPQEVKVTGKSGIALDCECVIVAQTDGVEQSGRLTILAKLIVNLNCYQIEVL